jgi:hypothetical protein
MNKIYKDPYGNDNAYEEAPSTWFSWCCGARYIKEPTHNNMTRGYRGIRVAVGDNIVNAGVHKKQEISVVQTKNGPLTVGVRHVW